MSIPASELAVMQAAAITTLDQVCAIQRKHPISDGYGSKSDNFQTVTQPTYGATSPCSVGQPSSQIMQNYNYLIGAMSSWVVRLPATADVQRDDLIVVGGQSLRVQIVLDLRSRLIDKHVLVSEIR